MANWPIPSVDTLADRTTAPMPPTIEMRHTCASVTGAVVGPTTMREESSALHVEQEQSAPTFLKPLTPRKHCSRSPL